MITSHNPGSLSFPGSLFAWMTTLTTIIKMPRQWRLSSGTSTNPCSPSHPSLSCQGSIETVSFICMSCRNGKFSCFIYVHMCIFLFLEWWNFFTVLFAFFVKYTYSFYWAHWLSTLSEPYSSWLPSEWLPCFLSTCWAVYWLFTMKGATLVATLQVRAQ